MTDLQTENPQNNDPSPEVLSEESVLKENDNQIKPIENQELDPRGKQVEEKILTLINSAQVIWKDAFDSQVRLTKKVDALQENMNLIKEYTAIPRYPAGLKLLELSIARINNVNSRLLAVHSRLNKVRAIIQFHKQKEAEAAHTLKQNQGAKNNNNNKQAVQPKQVIPNNSIQNTNPVQNDESQKITINTNTSETKPNPEEEVKNEENITCQISQESKNQEDEKAQSQNDVEINAEVPQNN